MPTEQTTDRTSNAAGANHRSRSPREEQERKERLLTQGRASVVASIAEAVVVKDAGLFFLAQPDGNVPLGGEHGLGLYYDDCRFLSGYELTLAGGRADVLASTAARGFMAAFQLTNPDIRLEDGGLIPKEDVGITWERVIDPGRCTLHDLITVENFRLEPIELPLALTFQARFEDVYAVRGLLAEQLGTQRPPAWTEGKLNFAYEGADGRLRRLTVHLSPAPHDTDGTAAHFRLQLEPRQRRRLLVSLVVAESESRDEPRSGDHAEADVRHVEADLNRAVDDWLGEQTEVRSDSPLLNRVVERSLRDLRMLRTRLDQRAYYAAGVPWFVALFGRDSLLTALQTLALDPSIAPDTLRLLASYQGRRVDDWRDEQPGKILHELRVGEMARTGAIPYTPYYGTVDATPLFLILLGRHAAWTGELALFDELRDHVERALAWIARYGDRDGDGYVEYQSSSDQGLVNQGWKDSGDAVVNADGSLAEPPIALVEVQGYVYLAKLTLADLYRRAGETERADRLRQEAQELWERFNRDFWLDDHGFYALALERDDRRVAVMTSNPGQALWTGIVDADKAGPTVERLMADDMFTGWGIRTLSDRERRYNPVGYHLGTVWPHDNALIAAGFRRYGYDDAFRRVFAGFTEAATYFAHDRLPELFAGFRRGEYGLPVCYPVSCHPQAWAAGSVPFLLATALGLAPEAFDRRLRIVRPVLPAGVGWIELRRLRVGPARVDLRFDRTPAGGIAVQVLAKSGDVDVLIEPAAGTAAPARGASAAATGEQGG